MSALHFISIDEETFGETHTILNKIHPFICMSQLLSVISCEEAYKQAGSHFANIISYEKLSKGLQAKSIFLHVASKTREYLDKNTIIIHQHTRIYTNITARSALSNCLGANCLFPFLYQLGQNSYIPKFSKSKLLVQCLELIINIWEYNILNRVSLGFIITEEIINLRYLLGLIGNQVEFSLELYNILQVPIKNMEMYSPDIVENYLELILLNMDIWKFSSKKTQIKIVEDFSSYLKQQHQQSLNAEKIVDLSLNGIRILANSDYDNNVSISILSDIILNQAKQKLTKEIFIIIMNHLNAYFLVNTKHCYKPIFYILSIFMELFSTYNKQYIDIIFDTLTSNKEVIQFAVMFTILDYFIYFKENGSSEGYKGVSQSNNGPILEKEENKLELKHLPISMSKFSNAYQEEFNNNMEDENMIDSIVAMCIYWMLSFDWKSISEFIWEYQKEDFLRFLLKHFSNERQEKGVSILLTYIFGGINGVKKQGICGIYCYLAFIYFAFDFPFKAQENIKDKNQKINNLVGDSQNLFCLKTQILELILGNINCFDLKAKKELFNDLDLLSTDKRFIQAVNKSNILVDLIFSLGEYPEQIMLLHHKLLCFNLSQDDYFDNFTKICLNLKGDTNYKLTIIDNFIKEILLSKYNQEPKLGKSLLLIMYIIEDSLVYYPENIDQKKMFLLLCKIIYLLHKTNWLYISLPSIDIFDERCLSFNLNNQILSTKNDIIYREGGFVRIILKILIKMINYDESKNKETIFLLRFYLLREKELCKYIKYEAMGKDYKQKSLCKERIKYNLIDLILRQNQEKMQTHQKYMQFFTDKVINKDYSLLNTTNLSKNKCKGNNIFESNAFYFFYLLAAFSQISHYELFEINNYKDIPHEDERIKALKNKISAEGLNERNQKMIMLAKLFYIIVQSKSLNDEILYLDNALINEFNNLIGSIELSHQSKDTINFTTVYNFLDQNFEQKESMAEEMASNIHENNYNSFKKSMPYRISSIINAIKNVKMPDEFCDKFPQLILGKDYLEIIQPHLLFVTSHNFSKIDNLIHSICSNKKPIKEENKRVKFKIIKELDIWITRSYFSIVHTNETAGNVLLYTLK